MAEEKYITLAEAEEAKTEPLRLRRRREAPSIAPYFLEEVRKYLEREYGSQRIYQGGLRVYTSLDSAMQKVATRAVRNGLRVLDKHARGFVPITEPVLEDGRLPDPLRLDDWDRPIVAGEVARGVVLGADRTSGPGQVGDYRATVGPREVAWTHRGVGEGLR